MTSIREKMIDEISKLSKYQNQPYIAGRIDGMKFALNHYSDIYEEKKFLNALQDTANRTADYFGDNNIHDAVYDESDLEEITNQYLKNHDCTIPDYDQHIAIIAEYFNPSEGKYKVKETSDAFPYKEDRFAIWDKDFDRYVTDKFGKVLTYEKLQPAIRDLNRINSGEMTVY